MNPPVWIGPAMLICGIICMFAISWPVASVVLTFTLVALAIISVFPRGCTLKRSPDRLLGCGRIAPSSRGEFDLPADVDSSDLALAGIERSPHTTEVAASLRARINCQESDAITANDKPLVGGHSF